MEDNELKKYHTVQNIAKDTIQHLKSYICKGTSEAEIAHAATEFMTAQGVTSFWYHGLGALVLVGDRTTLSISGKKYTASDKKVSKNDLVTVDLSPKIGCYWGDFARTFVVEKGTVITKPSPNSSKLTNQLLKGIDAERTLHQKLQNTITPDMTFEDIYLKMNRAIEELGYVNLDFKGNLGHSIEKNITKRIYIEKGNKTRITDVNYFTFEPHIKKNSCPFGYKMEDIYYFSNGILKKL